MFHHRSSVVKTKPKQSKPASQRAESRGPVKKVNTVALSKQDRINTLRQVRQTKREELIQRKRLGTEQADRPPPPKVVVLLALHTQADALSLKRRIMVACGMDDAAASALAPHEPVAAVLPNWAQGGPGSGRQRVVLIDPPRDLIAAMDVVKCADVLMCVLGPNASLEEPSFDPQGYRLLTALKSQGLPVVVGAVHGCDTALTAKKAIEAKKFVARYFASELGAENRLFHAGTDEEVKALVRGLGGTTPKEMTWRTDRGYMLAQEAEYSSQDGVLCLRGYVRGPGLRCKHLGHLTGHGDFVIGRIALRPDPCALAADRGSSGVNGEQVVDELPAGEGPDMLRLQPYDPTTAEQTWPSMEELGNASARRRRGAAAIPAPDGEGADAEMGDDAGEEHEEGGEDDADGSGSEGAAPSMAHTAMAETEDGWDVSSHMTMDIPNAEAVAAERRRREVLLQRSQEELEFPDEVDTPLDVPARERFQKFRGLKSFRTSPWDPYEDLPTEYSRIWEFESFNSTARAFRQQFVEDCCDMECGGVAAAYCAVYLRGVPPSVVESQPRGVPFVLSSLFPYEQKVSVVHGAVTRMREYTEAIKSKQEVTAHCGFRRFSIRPTYSEIPKRASTCRKFKFQRFLHQEVSTCASFFAPVVFPPCRLLLFTDTDRGPEMVATGSITGVDPKQLIIKRIVLTGYPFRTHKSKGVVRFMFFSPADVRWFKPVELATKKGLRGHITESLGTHGYMKCRFSGSVKQDDTVLMNLYKRVYPKWHPPAWGGPASASPEEA